MFSDTELDSVREAALTFKKAASKLNMAASEDDADYQQRYLREALRLVYLATDELKSDVNLLAEVVKVNVEEEERIEKPQPIKVEVVKDIEF